MIYLFLATRFKYAFVVLFLLLTTAHAHPLVKELSTYKIEWRDSVMYSNYLEMRKLKDYALEFTGPCSDGTIYIDSFGCIDKKLPGYELEDSYHIEKDDSDNFVVKANSFRGLRYAFRSLQSKYAFDSTCSFPIYEHPAFGKRVLHLSLTPNSTVEEIKEYVDLAHLHRFNVICLKLNRIKFDASFDNKDDHLNLSELIRIKNYIESYDLDIIPHVPLLTHQENQGIPDSLMINKETYKPNSPYIRDYIENLLSEVIEIFNPNYIFVGHDELYGYRNENQLVSVQSKVSATEFAASLNHISSFLARRGIKTIVWGDMFLDKKMFPEMYPKHLRGNSEFNKELGHVEKQLFFFDFHYWDHELIDTYDYLKNRGQNASGVCWGDTTNIKLWINTICAAESMVENRWIMAVTFSGALNHRREKLVNKGLSLTDVKSIIVYTGDYFWKGL